MLSVKHNAYLGYLQDTASVISNLLSESNRNSWEQLERVMHIMCMKYAVLIHILLCMYMYVQTSPSTGQTLVRSTEQVTKLLSDTLTSDTTEAIQTRTNIGKQTVFDVQPNYRSCTFS